MRTSPAITITAARPDQENELEQRPLEFGLIRRLFRYTHPHARKRNWLLGLVVMRAIQLPLLAWAIGAVINGPITRRDPRGILWGSLGFLGLATFTQFTFHFRQRLALELGESVVHDLRAEIFQHLLTLPMSFFHKTKLGRIISRITSDVDAVRVGVQDVLFVGMVQTGQMLVSAALMAWYDWVLFLAVAALAPILWGLNRLFHKRLSDAYRDVQRSFSRVTATLAESVSGIRVTQGFVRQDVNAGFFHELMIDQSKYNLGVARATAVLLPLLELNSQFFIAVLVLLGGYRVLSPSIHMSIGDLIQFFFLANLFFQPFQVVGQLYNQALTAMAGGERVFKLLDTRPEWTDPPDAVALPAISNADDRSEMVCLGARIEFRTVTFSYGADRPALREVSFIAEPGQTIALVGHTGSGKSSIINLIAKFYRPTVGEVLIDGHDILRVHTDSLHRQLGIVPQQNFLFTGTVLENIRFGRPTASDDDVVATARQLNCLDMIGALPQGFATPVGERGAGLSLGQRQLICFARALLANPRILILDEATSSVDSMTEARIQQSLSMLLRGRTSFVVAHRLSTIRHADQVLVLEDGRIVERGTHDELLATAGLYANLHRHFIQATEV